VLNLAPAEIEGSLTEKLLDAQYSGMSIILPSGEGELAKRQYCNGNI
jgi:hypothetical protein